MEDTLQTDTVALRLQLAAAGYIPLPLYGKTPPVFGKNNKRKGLRDWEKLDSVTRKQIEMWARTWPDATNTGVLTRFMPTLDIDILNEEAACAVEDYVRKRFEDRGRILPRIGRPPKRAIPFGTDTPFAKIVTNVIAQNGSAEKIEFLADGQQVVVNGVHPETGKRYHWHGGEPGEIARTDLPSIREEEAQRLIDGIVDLLVRDFNYQRARGRPRKRGKGKSKGNGKGGFVFEDGAEDWQYLLDNIGEGRELHDSLRDLAAKLIASGMSAGATVNYLRAEMNRSTAPHDARWEERFEDIPRLVDSAEGLQKKAKAHEHAKGKAEDNEKAPEPNPPPACSLDELHSIFRKWFGKEYDLDAIDAVIATGAAERLDGDPLWLLIVSGPGAAKTETVQALSGCGAHVTSTIQSEGALLSATFQQGRSKKATGGLLRKIGARGILVIKDVTTILSGVRDARATVLAALREVYDGRYERNVGSAGGQTLTWEGRIAIVGAVTTVWDSAHAVVAVMGDRFVLLRIDSDVGREESGLRSISNTGSEVQMRKELADAVGGLVAHASTEVPALTIEETRRLVKAADIVTLNRTAVERDFQGNVVNSHAPEMPTRFAKQLAQMLRGGVAVGMSRERAMELAIRCARDSIPPLRREIILDVASHPNTNPGDVRRRLNKPWTTVKREMEGLHMLGTLHCDEDTIPGYGGGKDKTVWRYRLAPEFDRATLLAMAGEQQQERNDNGDVIA
jgi:hypothetical protein